VPLASGEGAGGEVFESEFRKLNFKRWNFKIGKASPNPFYRTEIKIV
jgi:hypothetical protein